MRPWALRQAAHEEVRGALLNTSLIFDEIAMHLPEKRRCMRYVYVSFIIRSSQRDISATTSSLRHGCLEGARQHCGDYTERRLGDIAFHRRRLAEISGLAFDGMPHRADFILASAFYQLYGEYLAAYLFSC